MEFAMKMTRNFWLLIPILMAMSAEGQDANFGLKVKCYVRDGTVLCPGCNSRAGLTCPRNRKMESCNVKTETPYMETDQTMYDDVGKTTTVMGGYKPPTVPSYVGKTTVMEDFKPPTVPSYVKKTTVMDLKPPTVPNYVGKTTTVMNDFRPPTLPYNVSQEEIDWAELAKDIQFRLFVYNMLRPYGKKWRHIREAPAQEFDDTCEGNGDCPCPLICCKTGEGCPKRCMSGIRLPPPWG